MCSPLLGPIKSKLLLRKRKGQGRYTLPEFERRVYRTKVHPNDGRFNEEQI